MRRGFPLVWQQERKKCELVSEFIHRWANWQMPIRTYIPVGLEENPQR